MSAADGFSTTLKVNGKVTSLKEHNAGALPNKPLNLVVEAKSSSDNPPQLGENPSGENQQPSSWEEQYNEFLENGINILSFWVGSSAGNITYEFSDDAANWANSTKVVLDRANVEAWLSTLKNPESTGEQKNDAKSKLFGIQKKAQYMRLTAGKDLGGNHMGFEVFKKDGEGKLERQENVKFRYYDYRSGSFKDYSEHERDWEDYLKCSSYPVDGAEKPTQGLILDLNSLDFNEYILRAIIPFDSRKNISWWNYKYKEQVAAAGDQVSDDSWVENGNVELVKVVSGNQVYYSNEPNWKPDQNLDENLVVKVGKAGYDFENDLLREGYDGSKGKFTAEEMLEAAEKASGQCNVPEGSYVTVKLTPDIRFWRLN